MGAGGGGPPLWGWTQALGARAEYAFEAVPPDQDTGSATFRLASAPLEALDEGRRRLPRPRRRAVGGRRQPPAPAPSGVHGRLVAGAPRLRPLPPTRRGDLGRDLRHSRRARAPRCRADPTWPASIRRRPRARRGPLRCRCPGRRRRAARGTHGRQPVLPRRAGGPAGPYRWARRPRGTGVAARAAGRPRPPSVTGSPGSPRPPATWPPPPPSSAAPSTSTCSRRCRPTRPGWTRRSRPVCSSKDGAERVRFAHALVRDAVYGDLTPLTRRRLHGRAAAALEQRRVGRIDDQAGRGRRALPARRALRTRTPSVDLRGARRSRRRRRRCARGRRPPLDAAADLQAGDELAGDADRGRPWHPAWGTALRRSGRVADARAPLRAAAESALARGYAAAAAEALLVVTVNVMWSWRTEHVADEQAVGLWRRALDALAVRRRRPARANPRGALGGAMHDPPGGRCAGWADEALELSRRHGGLAVRVQVLQVVVNALRRPDLLPRRIPAADELVALCVRTGDERARSPPPCASRPLNHSASARPDAALADLRRAVALAERHHLAPELSIAHLGLSAPRQAEGDWQGSQEALRTAEGIQSTLSMPGVGLGRSCGPQPRSPRGDWRSSSRSCATAASSIPVSVICTCSPCSPAAVATRPGSCSDPGVSSPRSSGTTCGSPRRSCGRWSGPASGTPTPWPTCAASSRRSPTGSPTGRWQPASWVGAARARGARGRGGGPRRRVAGGAGGTDLHRRLGWTPWERLSQELLDQAEADVSLPR